MDIERTFVVAAPRAEVWEFITSPERVAPCLPGCESVAMVAPGKYKVVVAVKVGPIKATFNVDVDAVEERAPEYAVYQTRGEEGGKASRISADSTLALREIDAGHTEVTYTSKINIVGRLGKFAGGVMKKLADSMSDTFVAELRKRIEPPAPGEAAAGAEPGLGGKVAGFARRIFGGDQGSG
jgi:hypothetical protein